MDSEIAASKRAGLPTTPDELRERLASPGKTDGRTDLLAALGSPGREPSISAGKLRQAMMSATEGKLSLADRKSAEALAVRLEPQLKLLDRASLAQKLDLRRQYEEGPFMLMPDLACHLSLTGAAVADGYFRYERGDAAGAEQRLLTAARTARLLGDDPSIPSVAARSREEQTLTAALKKLLQDHPRDQRVNTLARRTLDALGPPIDLHRTVEVETVLATQFLPMIERYGSDTFFRDLGVGPGGNPEAVRWMHFRQVRELNEACLLRYWRTLGERLPADPADLGGFGDAQTAAESSIRTMPEPARVTWELMRKFADPSWAIEGSVKARQELRTLLRK